MLHVFMPRAIGLRVVQVVEVGDERHRMGPHAAGATHVGKRLQRGEPVVVVVGIPSVADKDSLPFTQSVEEPPRGRRLAGSRVRGCREPWRGRGVGPVDTVGVAPGSAGKGGGAERIAGDRRLDTRWLRWGGGWLRDHRRRGRWLFGGEPMNVDASDERLE